MIGHVTEVISLIVNRRARASAGRAPWERAEGLQLRADRGVDGVDLHAPASGLPCCLFLKAPRERCEPHDGTAAAAAASVVRRWVAPRAALRSGAWLL